jgi:hypothetical protein
MRTRGLLWRVLSLVLVLALAAPWVVWADVAVADGDGLVPVAEKDLALGTVCSGSTTQGTALVAIKRAGTYVSTNVFKKGSTVTVTVLSVSDPALSASITAPGTITIPADWDTAANNTMTASVVSGITLVAGSAGAFSGTITYRATGIRDDGTTLTRDDDMLVTATVETCTPTDTTPPTFDDCPAGGPFTLGSGMQLVGPIEANDEDGGSGIDNDASTLIGYVDTSSIGSKDVTFTAYDNAGNSAQKTCWYQVIFDWDGFFKPIDNGMLNVVKAGSAVPVKFSLAGDQGLNIFAAGYPKVTTISCDASVPTGEVEETVTAGQSSLSYDALEDQYVYVWKTNKSWTGCRRLEVKLIDGESYTADFKLK